MKTLLLISNKVPHYRVSVYNYLYRRFAQIGWEFKVASDGISSHGKEEARFDFRELRFDFARYYRLIREIGPDVVMFHLHLKDPIFWILIHWLKRKGVPVVCWTKGANLDRPDSRLRYHMFNHFHTLSDALILYSKEQTLHVKPDNRRKIFVANNTVNFEDYPAVPETREEIKTEFGIPFSKMVLFAGTMGVGGERKKVDHLIEVFRRLDRSDVGLVLVGGGMSDGHRRRLNPTNTIYLGEVHDPADIQISKLFKAADVFVMPGHVGLALNQAFYWGLPVITEEGAHPPEIHLLKSGCNGFVVRENDLDDLRNKMLCLLDSEEIREEFSRNAREDVLREASIEGMFQNFRKAVEYAEEARAGTVPVFDDVESKELS
jgi:glycosyltransferase involved in cell wall biosynthesis